MERADLAENASVVDEAIQQIRPVSDGLMIVTQELYLHVNATSQLESRRLDLLPSLLACNISLDKG